MSDRVSPTTVNMALIGNDAPVSGQFTLAIIVIYSLLLSATKSSLTCIAGRLRGAPTTIPAL